MDHLLKSTLILLIVSLFDCSNGYPNGQVQGSCSSMVPGHGVNAQTSAAPYSLSFSKSTYSKGEEITVTLSGSAPFRGFMMQARTGNSMNPVGSFKVNGNAQTLDCSSTASAVSHTSSDPKQSIQVTWVAPADSNSEVELKATVVQSRSVFWTGVSSPKLAYNAASGTNGTTAGNSGFQHTVLQPFLICGLCSGSVEVRNFTPTDQVFCVAQANEGGFSIIWHHSNGDCSMALNSLSGTLHVKNTMTRHSPCTIGSFLYI